MSSPRKEFDRARALFGALVNETIDVLGERTPKNVASELVGLSFDDILKNLRAEILIPIAKALAVDLTALLANERNSDLVRETMEKLFGNALVEELAESLGQVVMGPVVSLFERYGYDDQEPIENFASAFHGFMILMNIPKFLTSLPLGHVVRSVIGDISGVFEGIYWSLGLGFLGWQTLAPLLSSGLQPRLERHYRNIYRPNRFDFNTTLALYHLGEIRAADLLRAAGEEGWRPQDIQTLVDVGANPLGRGDLRDLLKAGRINNDEAISHLIRAGTPIAYADDVLDIMQQEESSQDKSISVSRVRRLYENQLISREQFRGLMRGLNYSPDAIQYELQLIDFELEGERRQLTLSQLKDQYIKGFMSREEIILRLNELNYGAGDVQRIIALWTAEKRPPAIKLSYNKILEFMRNGVLSRAQAEQRLLESGVEPRDIKLLVDNALLQKGKLTVDLTVSQILRARGIGAINQGEFNTMLTARGFDQSEIRILADIAVYNPLRELGLEDIRQAMINLVIDRGKAQQLLAELGVSGQVADLRINTWLAEAERLTPRLSIGQIAFFVKQGVISDAEATTRLVDQGLSRQDANLVVASALEQLPRELNSGEIKGIYLTDTISHTRAVELLVQTGLDSSEAKLLVESWDKLIALTRPQPTVTQYIAAFRDGALTETELVEKLQELNYSEGAIELYLSIARTQDYEQSRELTKADILGLFEDGLIGYQDALERLTRSGYSIEDAELLLARRAPSIEDSQAHSLMVAGFFETAEDYYEALIRLGYSPEAINNYLDGLGG